MLVLDVRLIYGLFLLIHQSCGLCTYPSDLRGTWYDSVYGNIAFTDSSMNMETKTFVSGFTNTNFTCQLNNGDMYVSKSVEAVTLGILGGFTVNVWICFEMKSLTTSSFYYYLRSSDQDNLNFGDVVPVATTVTTVTEADVCNTSPGVGEFHMLVNPASAKEGLSAVPVPLLGDFTYTMNFGTDSSQCGVSAFWEGCSNTTVITLNNTACGSQFVGYSASGLLGCITSFQDTTSTSVYYVGVYNFDTAVNGASTKRFTCFTVEFDTNITMVSQSPNKCSSGSSPTVLPTDGALLQLTTVTSCAPVTPPDDPLSIAAIFAIVFSLMLVIFLALVIGICCYRSYIKKHTKKIIIIPKTLPRGAHTVFTLTDTNTMVNKEIITEPKLVVKPIRNGQPQSMELQQWKHNAEFQEPEGQLKLVTKPQPHIATIDTMKSRVATQMREESERKRNQALVIDRVKTNLERELRVIAVLKAKDAANKDAYNREAAASKMSQAASIFPPKSRMSQYVHDPQAKSRTMSMRKNKITNGTIKTATHDNSFNNSFSYDPRTSTPLSIQRPSSIDMVMSEANLSVFSVDLKHRSSKTPRPQPDITVTKRIRDTKKFPTIKELSNMPGEFQNFER